MMKLFYFRAQNPVCIALCSVPKPTTQCKACSQGNELCADNHMLETVEVICIQLNYAFIFWFMFHLHCTLLREFSGVQEFRLGVEYEIPDVSDTACSQ